MFLFIMKIIIVKLFFLIPILRIEVKTKNKKAKISHKQKKIAKLQKEINSLNGVNKKIEVQ